MSNLVPGDRVRARVAGALLAALLLAGAGGAFASDEPAGGAPAAASNAWSGGWKAGLEEQDREVVSGDTMVVAAYGAMWVIVLLYVARLAAELRRLRRETDELRRQIEEAGTGRAAGPA